MIDFYKDKKVFLTGHTGFKGTWLSKILINWGAIVTGYALESSCEPNLFTLSGIEKQMNSNIGDIRDLKLLKESFIKTNPDIVIHLAAQPLVKESYENPHYTYETNVMGTVNILECVRTSDTVRSVLNVTTDKVYQNNESVWGYREIDPLDGYDPYSNSKSCSELVTHSYKNAFLFEKNISISTARAGNVIGGGDFAKNRIIPDCIKAAKENLDIKVRNPYSVRPYQHVLEPLFAYLKIIQMQYENIKFSDYYNVGPDEVDHITTGDLVELFCEKWRESTGKIQNWKSENDGGPHEANLLKLDCTKIKSVFGWKPIWNVEVAVEKTVEWANVYLNDGDIALIMDEQIGEFLTKEKNIKKI